MYNLFATLLCAYAYNLYIYSQILIIMKHISEILTNPFPAINVDHRPHSDHAEYIRQEKLSLIADIFRVIDKSLPMNDVYNLDKVYLGFGDAFDAMYDMQIGNLEILLANMQAELLMHMRYHQRKSMTKPFTPNYKYKRNRNSGDDSE